MRILYLMARPESGGGDKVVFQHASLLAARGHDVLVAGRGPRPDRAIPKDGVSIAYLDYSHLEDGEAPTLSYRPDLVLATYWTTLPLARRIDAASAAHFCQGFEPDWPHQQDRRLEIEAAYEAAGLPALVVTPHLGERLARRFGTPWRLTPPPVDRTFRPGLLGRLRRRPRRNPWILVPGIFQAEIKGVPTALETVRLLREGGQRCRLLRISLMEPTAEEETLLPADRFLVSIPSHRVASELRGCDLLLFPSRHGEGFGLPLLEAMASGVPPVASRIPSTEFATSNSVPLVPPDRPEAFAREAARLLASPGDWRRARRLGLAAARRFHPIRIAEGLDAAVTWAATGPGR